MSVQGKLIASLVTPSAAWVKRIKRGRQKASDIQPQKISGKLKYKRRTEKLRKSAKMHRCTKRNNLPSQSRNSKVNMCPR